MREIKNAIAILKNVLEDIRAEMIKQKKEKVNTIQYDSCCPTRGSAHAWCPMKAELA